MMHIITLVGNIRQMYIDSPVFPKRKVLVNAANTEAGQQYQFGSERDKLKHHVYQQLNQHQDDHSVLQKFRKEAEQLRKQKYEAKRKRSPQIEITPTVVPSKQFIPHPSRQIHLNPEMLPTSSRIIDEPSDRTIHQQRNYHQSGQQSERSLIHHYQKLLKVKDKELKKKAKKLQKCRMVIGKMNSKIDHLRQEKKIVAKEQELEMIKINALIDEMNYKIAENKITFREELARLKVELVDPTPRARAATRTNQSIPVLPKHHKINNHTDSERLLQGPSLYYQIPTKQTIDLIQREIDTNIESASAGLNRMKQSHLALQNQFEKYKEL